MIKKDKDELNENLWISNRALAITSSVLSFIALFLSIIRLS
jgi:hypothetical protein